jgi:hypothetical protein
MFVLKVRSSLWLDTGKLLRMDSEHLDSIFME